MYGNCESYEEIEVYESFNQLEQENDEYLKIGVFRILLFQ